MSSILDNFYKNLEAKNKKDSAVAIAIPEDKEPLIDILDEKPYNHATSFNYFATKLGLEVIDTIVPYEAAINLTNQGVIAIQVRKEICLVYFPDSITPSQYNYLEEELNKYKDLLFQSTNSIDVEGFVKEEDVLDYAKSIMFERKGRKI